MLWLRRLFIALLVGGFVWQLFWSAFPRQELALRSQLRTSLENLFPLQAKNASVRFGLTRLQDASPNGTEVVLVHGLDDPGKVWMNLVPALVDRGYGVSVFEYPNDQPIGESARLLHNALQGLYGQSFHQVSMIAHSMGGLVAREMLTNPLLACDPPACQRVDVDQLIMVGTPNQGSQLARLRGLSEVREQFSRLMTGSAGWLDWIFDGTGEAGIELLPGSEFLDQLNARAHPPDTAMVVIAGVVAKEQFEALNHLLGSRGAGDNQYLPGMGDMLVSVSSAKLDGVPIYRVSGNHLSIIRNISEKSTRIPPAIPIILSLLEE